MSSPGAESSHDLLGTQGVVAVGSHTWLADGVVADRCGLDVPSGSFSTVGPSVQIPPELLHVCP